MVKVIPRSGRIAAVLLGGLLAAVGTLAGGVEATASTGHDLPAGVPAVPSPGTSSQLNGIFCPSATNCWAVGRDRPAKLATLDETLHWNGAKWAPVAVPSPGGTGNDNFSELFGGRCTAPDDCWVVGDYAHQTGGPRFDLVLHWNGTTWSKVTVPRPGGTSTGSVSTLSDIACRSSSSCWAAGEYGIDGGGGAIRNYVLRWNGTKWSQVTVPNPGGVAAGDLNQLDSIRCPSDNDCWAVGHTEIESTSTELNEALHWDGTTWTVATVPNPGGTAQNDSNDLVNLACTSTVNCWAGGFYATAAGADTVFLNQLLHWDGTAWTEASTPQPGGTSAGDSNQISGVDCASSSDCWAVGDYSSNNGGEGTGLNQALRWDGTAWTQAVTPNPGGTAPGDISALNAVHCAGATLCWAVGTSGTIHTAGPNEALRWNGTTWSAG